MGKCFFFFFFFFFSYVLFSKDLNHCKAILFENLLLNIISKQLESIEAIDETYFILYPLSIIQFADYA